jgi:hypothetical protein
MDQFEKDRVEIAVMLHEYTGVDLINRIEDLCAAHYLRGYDDGLVWVREKTE